MPDAIDEIRKLLREVFTTETAVDEWLETKDPQFRGLTPREAASQPEGATKVRDLVLRMIHGIPP